MIDRALRTAAERGQSLILRVSPYQSEDLDVPAWYRDRVGPEGDLENEQVAHGPGEPPLRSSSSAA